jgi:hypothetical protein
MRSGARLIRATVAVRLYKDTAKKSEISDSQPFIPGESRQGPDSFQASTDESEGNETRSIYRPSSQVH